MALIAFNPPVSNGGCGTTGAAHGNVSHGRAPRRQGRILVGAGLALLPWLGYLAGTLPPAEAAAWVTLDALEVVCLLAAGTRLLRADPRHRAPAAAAAVLLVADACIDLATAAPGMERALATAMAVGAELPLAALCGVLAARAGAGSTAANGKVPGPR
ncbi:hypothetical protein [Streptomyces gilvosporeus]|uniref:Uncharacterized protein n=1 Tax=Streptomyces gilvosporeus TaxID=553510 RepID=A0A1V0TQL4_9ACTN|nr:hypothetical protein [Streptomyces gilvosporeus]ARF55247.1 hypothetical protein B1H19_14550 [Streptomyces gilvosporeus]